MNKKIVNIRIFAISAVVILVAVSFHPALDPFWDYVSSIPEDDFDLFSSFASASELDDIIISSMKPDCRVRILFRFSTITSFSFIIILSQLLYSIKF